MKYKVALSIIALCALLLSGCGERAESPSDGGEAVGQDWRTWGTVDEYGTVHISDGDIDVCACVFGDRVELYYDQASQSLYKQIDYPEKLTTEQYEKAKLLFDDFDGDGFTDLRVTVEDAEGTELWWTWAWDTDDFVYQAALAYPPVPVEGETE